MRVWRFTLVAVLLGTGTAFADPFNINLLSATFRTRVSTTADSPGLPTTSRQTVSNTPTSDSLLVPVAPLHPSLPAAVGAIAETGVFSVHADTTSSPSLTPLYASSALALTELLFAPLQNGVATIDLDLTTSGSGADHWSEGTISLFDTTTNAQIWNYGWDSIGAFMGGSGFWRPATYGVLLDSSPLLLNDILSIGTAFDASHQYRLLIYTLTQSQNDHQGITLEVSGLHEVPEPASIALLGVGALIARQAARRRARRGQPRFDAS